MVVVWEYTKVAGITFLTCVLVYAVGALAYDSIFPPDDISENGSYSDIPSIEASPDYGEDFKTYSNSAFSFSYPPHFEVFDMLSHIVLSPVDKDSKSGKIIVSIGLNDENMTAEEWFLSPDSGYTQSKDLYGDYHKATIDGQDAVYTSGGMWTVVNIPDDEFRLSIADLTGKGENIPFTEMGIVIESLVFNR